MNKRVLLQVLEDKRVQKLIIMGVELYKDYPKDELQMNIIQALKEELKGKDTGNPPRKWIQSEFNLD